MKKVIVASTNPVKINATRLAFGKAFSDEQFDVQGVAISSNVPDQPKNDEETLRGATNRAKGAKKAHPKAHFWVGIEGGIDYHMGDMILYGWVVIMDKKRTTRARGATVKLAKKMQELVEQGMELGHVDDLLFGHTNSKHGLGSTGLLTKGLITRTDYFEHTAIHALVPFLHPDLYE